MERAGGEPVFAGQVRASPPRVAPRFVRVVCVLILAVVAYGLWRVGARGIELGYPDFEYFYKGGASVLERGGLDPGYDVSGEGKVLPRGSIEWYPPFVSRVLTLLAWLPQERAGLLWLALNLAATLATVRLVGRELSGLPAGDWPVTQLVPFVALWLFWFWEYKLNQINNLTLLLLVAAFVCWRRRRAVPAGLWLGLAVLIKVAPVLLMLWFALKREFRVVGAAVVTVLLAGPVADVIAFGPSYAIDCYREWLGNAVGRGSSRQLILAQREMDWRNQGLGAVASRWLHPTNYATHFDNEPRMAKAQEVLTVNVAELSGETVARIVTGIQAVSLLGLVWLGRRAARRLTAWQLRLEWALFMLAMLWFMPVMRGYHVVWAYPALAILGGAVHRVGWRDWWSLITLVCIVVVVAGQFSTAVFDLESERGLQAHALGAVLGMVLMVAVPTIVLLLRLRRCE